MKWLNKAWEYIGSDKALADLMCFSWVLVALDVAVAAPWYQSLIAVITMLYIPAMYLFKIRPQIK